MTPITIADLISGIRVARAEGDRLITEAGQTYIDLFCGAGTVFLGHAHPAITAAVHEQLDRAWITGVLPTAIAERARTRIESFFPASYATAGLYSTGMEAAEFAMRLARVATGRRGYAGFDGSMHGKSVATASLGWPNDLVRADDFHRLPSPAHREAESLDRLRSLLSSRTIAAVFLELLQASSGGYCLPAGFVHEVARLCSEHGTLLVADEILTGFHRTGGCFLYQSYRITPDVVLIGKAMANGFPASAVVVGRQHAIDPRMLPGSTFAGNPIAAAAIVATLDQLSKEDRSGAVAAIEATVLDTLGALREAGFTLRGKGALWVLELPRDLPTERVLGRILQGGVIVSPAGRYLRLLPPAIISPDRLQRACTVIRDACLASAPKPAALR